MAFSSPLPDCRCNMTSCLKLLLSWSCSQNRDFLHQVACVKRKAPRQLSFPVLVRNTIAVMKRHHQLTGPYNSSSPKAVEAATQAGHEPEGGS